MKTSLKQILSLLVISILFSSCASVYMAPNAKQQSVAHEIVAILKPNVSIKARWNDSLEAIKESQRTSATEFQQEIYSYMLFRKSKGQMFVEIQDVDETNALLNKNNVDIRSLTSSELCKLLGVDALITSNFGLSKPMSTGGAVALGLLTGYEGSTNEVVVSMSIKDCKTKSLLWKYDHTHQGGLGSTASKLVDGLMRNASKKMPYFFNGY